MKGVRGVRAGARVHLKFHKMKKEARILRVSGAFLCQIGIKTSGTQSDLR